MLFIFGGLPGSGKSSLAKYLAAHANAVYLRIDTIEQRLKDSGVTEVGELGYKIAFDIAVENLRNGQSVVADSANNVEASRIAWQQVAIQAGSPYVEIEVLCTDPIEHQSRIENRISDIPNLVLPNWVQVKNREYQRWDSSNIKIDTAHSTLQASQKQLVEMLRSAGFLEES